MGKFEKCTELEHVSPEFPYMPKEEWESRIKRAKELMAQENVEGMLICNRKDWIYYFGWMKPYKYAFPNVGIIPREGPTAFVGEILGVNHLGLEGYAERAIAYPGDSRAPTPRAPDPIELLAEVIKDLGLDSATIGMEFGQFMWWEGMTMNEWEKLKSLLPHAKFVDVTDSIIFSQRMIKSEWEIGVMRKLFRAAARGYFRAIDVAKVGINERDLFYAMLDVWKEEGILDTLAYEIQLLQSSRKIATSRYQDHILEKGDYIFFDGGPTYKGYESDIQRMLWIGDPGPKVKAMGRLAQIGQEAAEALVKPGVTCGELWQAGHEAMAKIDPSIWDIIRSPKWIGWVGHSEGLCLHEPPYIVENDPTPLRPGMTIVIEIPTLDLEAGTFFNMPENLFLVTKEGSECLTVDFGPNGIYIRT